ncbi:hypothetical protein D0962_22910 [Leptolyngbyaceae cyanobacterium CCMR0082]|uniref:Uncharacterized protein n=1 Tax=Adonisia turfae CCMR0082 TaxID=2304604 RepID=A0A6M0SC56_9CYAN|nr:hypothetical protein [Adonisia turfae]NEZ65571.1 hypothetical protein [Adonisia turfae CCMR0082]
MKIQFDFPGGSITAVAPASEETSILLTDELDTAHPYEPVKDFEWAYPGQYSFPEALNVCDRIQALTVKVRS